MIESCCEGWKERFCTVRTHLAFSWHICFTSEESKQNKTVLTKLRDKRTRHKRYGRLKCHSSTEAFEDFATCQPPYRRWRSQGNRAVTVADRRDDNATPPRKPLFTVHAAKGLRVIDVVLLKPQTAFRPPTCYRGWTYYSTACIIHSMFHIVFAHKLIFSWHFMALHHFFSKYDWVLWLLFSKFNCILYVCRCTNHESYVWTPN